jgi:hypothetical protein
MGAAHSTSMLLVSGLPSTEVTPSNSLNSFLIDITQWPQDIFGIEKVVFAIFMILLGI